MAFSRDAPAATPTPSANSDALELHEAKVTKLCVPSCIQDFVQRAGDLSCHIGAASRRNVAGDFAEGAQT